MRWHVINKYVKVEPQLLCKGCGWVVYTSASTIDNRVNERDWKQMPTFIEFILFLSNGCGLTSAHSKRLCKGVANHI